MTFDCSQVGKSEIEGCIPRHHLLNLLPIRYLNDGIVQSLSLQVAESTDTDDDRSGSSRQRKRAQDVAFGLAVDDAGSSCRALVMTSDSGAIAALSSDARAGISGLVVTRRSSFRGLVGARRGSLNSLVGARRGIFNGLAGTRFRSKRRYCGGACATYV